MKMKLIVMFAAIALVAGTAQAELLNNTGFELGTYAPKNMPASWYVTGYYTTIAITTGQHNWNSTGGVGGGKCVSLVGRTYVSGTATYTATAFLGQYVPAVTAGTDYSFSVWTKSATQGVGATPYGYYTWWDAASGWAGYGWLTGDIVAGDTWAKADFGSVTAPATAVSATFYLASSGTNGILYDDASMVPEPVTLSLLGLGGLALVRRRKA